MKHGTTPPGDLSSLIEGCITELLAGSADSTTFYRIAELSLQNPVTTTSPPMSPLNDPSSPISFDSSRSLPSLHCDVWEENKKFDRLLKAMVESLSPEKVFPSQFHSMHLRLMKSRLVMYLRPGSLQSTPLSKINWIILKAKRLRSFPCFSVFVIRTKSM